MTEIGFNLVDVFLTTLPKGEDRHKSNIRLYAVLILTGRRTPKTDPASHTRLVPVVIMAIAKSHRPGILELAAYL